MAIKRQNPVIVLDCVIAGVERKSFRDNRTGELVDRGRELTVQTGGGQLLVKVRPEQDDVPFEQGVHHVLNVEYNEWAFTDEVTGRERSGSTMTFHSFVTEAQLVAWRDAVKNRQTKVEQPA